MQPLEIMGEDEPLLASPRVPPALPVIPNKHKWGVLSKIPWRASWKDLVAISTVYFIEGIMDMASTAVSYYLKDALGLTPSVAGAAYTVGLLPWNVTPMLGLITDSYPIFGYHRKGYLMVVGLAGAVSWLLLRGTVNLLLVTLLVFVSNACVAWTQVIADAVTVKLSQGQDMDVAGFYQGLSWSTYTVGAVLSAYTTGVLLEVAGPRAVFLLAAGCLALDSGCAVLISERKERLHVPSSTTHRGQRAGKAAGNRERAVSGGGGWHSWWVARQQGPVWMLLRQVWHTVQQPHIRGPAVFIFVWQSTPAPTSAMFYFQTNVLGFSPGFIELVYLVGSLAGLAGVLLYNLLLVNRSMRTTLAWCAALGSTFNATQLLLVSRANKALGISDKAFALGDYSMLMVVAEVMMTPMLALAAKVCPEGAEATLYATLYSVLNLSQAVSSGLGSALTAAFGVTESDFTHMLALSAVCSVWMLLPLPLLWLVPNSAEVPRGPAPATTAVNTAGDKGGDRPGGRRPPDSDETEDDNEGSGGGGGQDGDVESGHDVHAPLLPSATGSAWAVMSRKPRGGRSGPGALDAEGGVLEEEEGEEGCVEGPRQQDAGDGCSGYTGSGAVPQRQAGPLTASEALKTIVTGGLVVGGGVWRSGVAFCDDRGCSSSVGSAPASSVLSTADLRTMHSAAAACFPEPPSSMLERRVGSAAVCESMPQLYSLSPPSDLCTREVGQERDSGSSGLLMHVRQGPDDLTLVARLAHAFKDGGLLVTSLAPMGPHV